MYATLGGLNLSNTELDTGVIWTSRPIDGWGGVASRLAVTPKPRSHGAWAGNGYAGARSLALSGTVQAPTEAALSAALDRLNNACGFDDTLLTITEPDRSRWCMVRRTGEVLTPRLSPTVAAWSIQVVAADPRKRYAAITRSTALPSTSGGTKFPVSFPMSFTATSVTGQISITNPGNETGPVTARLTGPFNGPIITHVGTGLRLVFAASATIGAGEYWDIDFEAQTVLAQGQSSRATWVTSRQWFGLESGDNTFALSAASYTTGTLSVTATPCDK